MDDVEIDLVRLNHRLWSVEVKFADDDNVFRLLIEADTNTEAEEKVQQAIRQALMAHA